MERKRKLTLAKIAAVMSAIPFLLYAYEYGPDAGVAGVPGENGTCSQVGCHTGTGVNAGGGSVSVALPQGLAYAPGTTQHLVVTIDDAAQRRWGFELTARLANDTKTVAGTFSPTDNRTQLMCASADLVRQVNANSTCAANLPLVYIEHTLAGYNAIQPNPGKYEFDWNPPATDVGPVTIYVAANAANGDLTQNGDHIYTATYTLTAQSACQPGAPTISAVQNGAGFQNNIQQQSWVQIKGCNLTASSSRLWAASDFVNGKLPLKLDDVSATIDGKPAVVYYISATQLNVLAPVDATSGSVNVVVSNGNGTSAPFKVDLQQFSPAFFPWGKYPVATIGSTWIAPAGFFGAGVTTVPAKPGDTITLWGTGFGPTNPPAPTDVPVPSNPVPAITSTPTITVGGIAAQYVSGVLAPGTVGLYQIAIKLPASLTNGDQALTVTVGGVSIPDAVFLNIQK
jgi:uncharacterized protein (TIGR03437 family)